MGGTAKPDCAFPGPLCVFLRRWQENVVPERCCAPTGSKVGLSTFSADVGTRWRHEDDEGRIEPVDSAARRRAAGRTRRAIRGAVLRHGGDVVEDARLQSVPSHTRGAARWTSDRGTCPASTTARRSRPVGMPAPSAARTGRSSPSGFPAALPRWRPLAGTKRPGPAVPVGTRHDLRALPSAPAPDDRRSVPPRSRQGVSDLAAGDVRPNGGVNARAAPPLGRTRPVPGQVDNASYRLVGREVRLSKNTVAGIVERSRPGRATRHPT
jgi:hypothetical protein